MDTKVLKMNMENEIEEKETPEENQKENQSPKTDTEKTEDKSKELLSALAQKDHFREKAEKAEAKAKELEEKLSKASPGVQAPVDPLKLVEFAKAVDGFSAEEIGFAAKNAKDRTPEAIMEALKDPWVNDAIQARRDKVDKEKKALEPESGFTGKKPYGDVEEVLATQPKFGEIKSPESEAKIREMDYKMKKHIEEEEKKFSHISPSSSE